MNTALSNPYRLPAATRAAVMNPIPLGDDLGDGLHFLRPKNDPGVSPTAADPLGTIQPYAEGNPVNARWQSWSRMVTVPLHPMAVAHLWHLMSHYGIWAIRLLAAGRIGVFVYTFLEGGRTFYFLTAAFLILALDSAAWFRRRGNLGDAFLVPGAVLFLIDLVSIFLLHLRDTL